MLLVSARGLCPGPPGALGRTALGEVHEVGEVGMGLLRFRSWIVKGFSTARLAWLSG